MNGPTDALWGALLKAQENAQAIEKTGRNTAQGWVYFTVEEVTRVAREALNGAGLVAVLRVPADATYAPTVVEFYLHLIHPESGGEARFPVPWAPDRAGPQARRAAYAYARKQALLELLALSEADPETEVDPEKKARPARPKPAPQTDPGSPRRTVTRQRAPRLEPPPPDLDEQPQPPAGTASTAQLTAMAAAMGALGYRSNDDRHHLASRMLGHDIASAKELTSQEAHRMLDQLSQAQASGDPQAYLTDLLGGSGDDDQ